MSSRQPGSPGRGAAASAPLVGREEELARIEAALSRTSAGTGELVWLLGPGGIGKSRLAQAAAELADGQGLGPAPRAGRAHRRHPPLMVMAAAAREFERHRPFAVLAECLHVHEHPDDARRAR